LARYKKSKENEKYNPLSLDDITNIEGQAPPDWPALLRKVLQCRPGTSDAVRYEKATEGLLTGLFYPNLTNPIPQHKIHDGRKRIDITYTNMGTHGFFAWLAKHYPSAHVFVECKNYTCEINNPELDQLSGRFSPSRGKVGLIVCRQFEDKQLFMSRCKDTAQDGRGFIIALDDEDLTELVQIRTADDGFLEWPLLRERFNQLIN
jgi:hypothetical protein